MNPSYPPPQFLVIAPPDTVQANELTDALRQSGWYAALATTAEQIVPPLTAALVVLSPTTTDHPIIQAAANIQGLRRIPIFTEPMVLPYGDWASAPVLLQATTSDTVRAVMVAVFGPPPQLIAPMHPPMMANTPQHRSLLPWVLGIISMILAAIVVVTSILLVNAHSGRPPIGVSPTATPLLSYTADNPGLNCDHGDAIWRTLQQAQLTCQPNGTLLSVLADNGLLRGVVFEPPTNPIPQDYRVAVQATFASGDANTAVFINVHQQLPYGSQVFVARANGRWFIYRLNSQGKVDVNLDGGNYAPPAKTLTLQVEVHGGNMVYTINGQSVSAINDNTYLTSLNLLFGIYDVQGTTPFSALFTHFVYTPLR
jgi:hypothetical protein